MNYLYKIHLSGRISDDCVMDLANVKVCLYRRSDKKTASLAAADPKTTFSQLDADQVAKKSALLLAEGVTDENGNVDLQLIKGYDGDAFDVDIKIDEHHFHLTTQAPMWRKYENGYVATWDYCMAPRIWCHICGIIGKWIICGQVVHCKTKAPIGGVNVTAFDRDWLQDDPLGTATTDSNGYFWIEYTEADFKPGTWIDMELFGGPDVYFHIRHPSSAPLLIEPPSKGRESGRENIGHCFCTTLCLDKFVPEDEPYPPPVFTHVGSYNHQTAIDSAPGDSGLINPGDRAFYRTIRLNGSLPKKFAGGPMEYRFEFEEVQADGTVISSWTAVDMTKISRTVIGQLLKYAPAYPGDPNPIKSEDYTVNGNPGEKEANVVGGWIQVPQESNTFGPSGFFQPNGNQIRLNTRTVVSWPSIDLTGLATGISSTSTGKPLAQNRYFGLRMWARKVGDPTTEQVAGVCQQLAVNNTRYDNIERHPIWMLQTLSNQLGVAMVDIQQLIVGGGCSGITTDLDVLFTAAQPNLGVVAMSMSGPGGPYSFTLPAAVPGEQFGTATPNFVVKDLNPCAYIVTLSVEMLLTTGDHIPDKLYDHIAFCKV